MTLGCVKARRRVCHDEIDSAEPPERRPEHENPQCHSAFPILLGAAIVQWRTAQSQDAQTVIAEETTVD